MKKLVVASNTVFGVFKPGIAKPVKLYSEVFIPTMVYFDDGSLRQGECLNCLDQPCRNYGITEIKTDQLSAMPYNSTTKVCPTDAIQLGSKGFPVINLSQCIGCGLCISRCNYGAINLNENYVAVINVAETSQYDWVTTPDDDAYNGRAKHFKSLPHEVGIKKLDPDFFENLYGEIFRWNKKSNGFENLVTRNIMINLGFCAKIRTIGNNDIRFDLIATLENQVYIGEIGLNGLDILEEPRAILDDVAVLVARYGYNKKVLQPLIVNLNFPNKRSDVYEVISDIADVLGLSIQVISLHFLVLLNLYRKRLSLDALNGRFLIGKDKKSIEDDAEAVFSSISITDPLFGSAYYAAIK